MKKLIKKYKELPFEVDKIYQTKFATGEKVLLKQIKTNNQGKIIGFGVIYQTTPHLGICPLDADRLISDKVEDGEIYVCSKCGEPIMINKV